MKVAVVFLAVLVVCAAIDLNFDDDGEMEDLRNLIREGRSCGDKRRFFTCFNARRNKALCEKKFFAVGCKATCGKC